MRTSVFVRPTQVHYITLHEDLYRICQGNACAAMLMDYFIREHDRRLWEGRVRMDGPEDTPGNVEKWAMTIQCSVEFLCDVLVWSYSKNSISEAMKKLSEWGMIRITKERPKGREYDRRHYLTVNEDEVQRLFTDLASGIPPSKTMVNDLPKLGNQSAEVGKSLTEMKLVKERGRETVAAEAAQELRSIEADPHSPTPNSAAPPSPCPPAPKKPRPRDPIMDAIVTACGGDPLHQTQSQWSLAAKAKKEILEVDPNITPTAIIQFGIRKRREWQVATCSPAALTKHWESQQAGSPLASEDDPFAGRAVVTYQEVQDRFGEGQEAVRVCSMLERQGRLEW
jgi:hypothetical protein